MMRPLLRRGEGILSGILPKPNTPLRSPKASFGGVILPRILSSEVIIVSKIDLVMVKKLIIMLNQTSNGAYPVRNPGRKRILDDF